MPDPLAIDFAGRHSETGSIANVLALRGARAPHTGQPYSEALLLGLTGGIAFGYFVFEWKGLPPQLALLTRNTFDPLDTLFERLALPREVVQTTNPATGHANLVKALDSGHPALVWVDRFSLPYSGRQPDPHNWGMQPIVVFGYQGDTFYVADRSRRAHTLSAEQLTRARGRVKQDRFRLITLEPPDPARLPAAVQKGLWQCLSLFTEAPPKGARTNFGLAAYQHWAKMLINTRPKQGWEQRFPPGPNLWHALAGDAGTPGAYDWLMTWGAGPGAERGVFADLLDEAAMILERPALREVAAQFRQSCQAWCALAQSLLPGDIPLLAEARALLDRRSQLFIEQGQAALPAITQANARLAELRQAASAAYPLSADQAAAQRAELRQRVLKIHDLEKAALEAMQRALG